MIVIVAGKGDGGLTQLTTVQNPLDVTCEASGHCAPAEKLKRENRERKKEIRVFSE